MVAIHSIIDPLEMGKHTSMPGGVVSGCAYLLVKNLYIIHINGFSAFMDMRKNDRPKRARGNTRRGRRPACSIIEWKRFVGHASITCLKLRCIRRRKTESWSRSAKWQSPFD